jgi:hypothetical protein
MRLLARVTGPLGGLQLGWIGRGERRKRKRGDVRKERTQRGGTRNVNRNRRHDRNINFGIIGGY